MAQTVFQERRQYRRYRIEREAVLLTDDHELLVHMKTRDISARGVSLVTDSVLPVSLRYRISLALGEDSLDMVKGRYIQFAAELITTVRGEFGSKFRYGFRIVDIEPRFEALLNEFLDEQARAGDTPGRGNNHAGRP